MAGSYDNAAILLHKKIGKGTFGHITLCENTSEEISEGSHKYFAVKIISKKQLLSWNLKREGETEKKTLELESRFMVDLYFAYESALHLFLGMEYCPGGDLYQLLVSRGPLNVEQARIYLAEITLALLQLHQHSTIFRDLKPESVVISASGHVKLIDFGMACVLDDTSDEGTGIISESGTLLYSPPEFLLRWPHKTECDWWNLGVLLYEMLTGTTPFEAETEDDTIRNICSPQRDPIIPEALKYTSAEMFILQLLQVDQTQRLGFGDNTEEITDHTFFNAIEWEKIKNCEYTPEFIPELSGPLDTRYFDGEDIVQDLPELTTKLVESPTTELATGLDALEIGEVDEEEEVQAHDEGEALSTDGENPPAVVDADMFSGYKAVRVFETADCTIRFEPIETEEIDQEAPVDSDAASEQ